MKKYIVRLMPEEQAQLLQMTRSGKAAARTLPPARILLKAERRPEAPAGSDEAIREALEVPETTLARARQRFVEEGLEAALRPKLPTRQQVRKLAGQAEAHRIALAGGPAPDGRAPWTLRLLADQLVELQHVASVSHESVRQTLKKNELPPHLQECWAIAPEHSAEFVAAREEGLTVYQRPRDPVYPVICMEETSKQLVGETRVSRPVAPGPPQRRDYEDERRGVANLFLFSEPLTGWREVQGTERRTRGDCAEAMRELSNRCYLAAERIAVVLDHLNTHGPASFQEAFAPDEARRLSERCEFHYTPKHGRWLNRAEIELRVLSRQGLDRRLDDAETLRNETQAWQQRNVASKTIDGQFTTADAQVKLKRLYPVIKT